MTTTVTSATARATAKNVATSGAAAAAAAAAVAVARGISSAHRDDRHISPDSAIDGAQTHFGSSSSGTGSAGDDEDSVHGAVFPLRPYNVSDELPRTSSRQQIDKLLDESLAMFHRDGPLVNPLDAASNAAGASDSTMEQRLRFVCSSKGFDFGIFWKFDDAKQGLDAAAYVTMESAAHSGVPLFVHTSYTMFTRWSTGFGMPGRIGYTGNYEWHEDIRQLPAWSFQRIRQAEQAGLRTVIGVPIESGVVEFGTTKFVPHNITTVSYVQKICTQKTAPSNSI